MLEAVSISQNIIIVTVIITIVFCLYSFKYHCAKSVPIRSCSDLYFLLFGLNTEILFSVQIQENADQKNSVFGQFLCSVYFSYVKYNTRRQKYEITLSLFHFSWKIFKMLLKHLKICPELDM